MTLIASLRVDDCPMLIGDLLLSSKLPPGKAVVLPTLGELPDTLSSGAENHIVGIHQKICIVNPRLAVAWSGSLVDARDVMRQMKDHFSNRTIDHTPLIDFFKTRPKEVLKKVDLICLYSNGKGRNDFGIGDKVVDIDTPNHGLCFVGGSGTGDFINMLYQEVDTGLLDGSPNQLHTAVCKTLFLSSQLMANELINGINLSTVYGGGTEIATFSDGKFQKLGDILYSFWKYQGEGREAHLRFMPFIFKLDYVDDTLIFRRITFSEELKDDEKPKITSSLNFFVPSILLDPLTPQTINLSQTPDLNARFHVPFIRIPNKSGGFGAMIPVHQSPNRKGPVSFAVDQNDLLISFNREILLPMLMKIVEIRSAKGA